MLVLFTPILRLGGVHKHEKNVLVIGSIMGVISLLRFARGFQLSGPYVVMIWQMATGDVMRFLLIYIPILCGFAGAFTVLFHRDSDDSSDTSLAPPGFENFENTMVTLFLIGVGSIDGLDTQILEAEKSGGLATFLYVLYILLVIVLLLNLLIGMMSHTQQRLYENITKIWEMQWARTIMQIESSHDFVTIGFSGNEDDEKGVKGKNHQGYLMLQEHKPGDALSVKAINRRHYFGNPVQRFFSSFFR